MKQQQPLTAAAELREATRDAHAAAKDLRQAIREARQFAQAASRGAVDDIGQTMKLAGEVIEERLEQAIEKLSESALMCLLCPKCQALLAMLFQPGADHHCPECGAKFIVRAKFREQAVLGLRKKNIA